MFKTYFSEQNIAIIHYEYMVLPVHAILYIDGISPYTNKPLISKSVHE